MPEVRPARLVITGSRPSFLLVATDAMRRVVRGADGVLLPHARTILDGAVTRAGGQVTIDPAALPPQVARLVVVSLAGPEVEFVVSGDATAGERHVVQGGEACAALSLRRRGQRWTVMGPGERIGDVAAYLEQVGAAGVWKEPGSAGPKTPTPRAQTPGPPTPRRQPTPPRPSPTPAASAPTPGPRGGRTGAGHASAADTGAGASTSDTPSGPGRVRRTLRRVAITVAAIALIGAGAFGATLLAEREADRDPPVDATTAVATATSEPEAATARRPQTDEERAEASEVGAALEQLPDDPASLLPAGSEQSPEQAREAVPEGTTIEVDEPTWAPDGVGGGVMRVVLTGPDGDARPYVAVMVQEEGAWKVLSTFEEQS